MIVENRKAPKVDELDDLSAGIEGLPMAKAFRQHQKEKSGIEGLQIVKGFQQHKRNRRLEERKQMPGYPRIEITEQNVDRIKDVAGLPLSLGDSVQFFRHGNTSVRDRKCGVVVGFCGAYADVKWNEDYGIPSIIPANDLYVVHENYSRKQSEPRAISRQNKTDNRSHRQSRRRKQNKPLIPRFCCSAEHHVVGVKAGEFEARVCPSAKVSNTSIGAELGHVKVGATTLRSGLKFGGDDKEVHLGVFSFDHDRIGKDIEKVGDEIAKPFKKFFSLFW